MWQHRTPISLKPEGSGTVGAKPKCCFSCCSASSVFEVRKSTGTAFSVIFIESRTNSMTSALVHSVNRTTAANANSTASETTPVIRLCVRKKSNHKTGLRGCGLEDATPQILSCRRRCFAQPIKRCLDLAEPAPLPTAVRAFVEVFLHQKTVHAVQLVIVEGLQQILRFAAIKLWHPSVPPLVVPWACGRNPWRRRQGDVAANVSLDEGGTLRCLWDIPVPRLSRDSLGRQPPEKEALNVPRRGVD